VVTITYNGSNYSADKTYAEILDAVHAGFNVVAKFADEWYTLAYVNESKTTGAICFSSVIESYNGVQTISISRTNFVTKKAEKKFLPLVASSDNGSELIVRKGAWAKQQKKFLVTLTPTSPDYSGTMDKTVAQINTAYEAGQQIVFRVMKSETDYMDVDCTAQWHTSATYPSFNGFIVMTDNNALVFAHTGTTSDGTDNTYGTTLYSLTPAS
jgi:hypothetical protein